MKPKHVSAVSGLCIAAVLAGSVSPCSAGEEPGPAAVAVDAVVVRPLSFAAAIVGGAIFVIALPVAATSKSVKQTGDALVGKAWRATFKRPLGDFDALEQGKTSSTKQDKPEEIK